MRMQRKKQSRSNENFLHIFNEQKIEQDPRKDQLAKSSKIHPGGDEAVNFIEYDKNTPLRDLVYNLFKIHEGKDITSFGTEVFNHEFKLKIGDKEVKITEPLDIKDIKEKEVFANFSYNDEKGVEKHGYIKEEPYTWAAISKENKRAVFKEYGKYYNSKSRKTDWIGGDFARDVEAEIRRIFDNRRVVEKMKAELDKWNLQNESNTDTLNIGDANIAADTLEEINKILSNPNPDYQKLSTEETEDHIGFTFVKNERQYLIGINKDDASDDINDRFTVYELNINKKKERKFSPVVDDKGIFDEAFKIISNLGSESKSKGFGNYREETVNDREEDDNDREEDDNDQKNEDKPNPKTEKGKEKDKNTKREVNSNSLNPSSDNKKESWSFFKTKTKSKKSNDEIDLHIDKQSTKGESTGSIIDELFKLTKGKPIEVRLDPESTKTTQITQSGLEGIKEGHFAEMKYKGENYTLKEEPYTWKSGHVAAISKDKTKTRLVLERDGSLWGKWQSRPTDHVGFKEPFVRSINNKGTGTSISKQLEDECRRIFDSHVRLKEMSDALQDHDSKNVLVENKVQSEETLDPRKMALLDCIKHQAFNNHPHAGLSLEQNEDGKRVGLKFTSSGNVFAIRVDKEEKSLVISKLVPISKKNEWQVLNPEEVDKHKIYDKAIRVFGIDQNKYQEFLNEHNNTLGIESAKSPSSNVFTRNVNFSNSHQINRASEAEIMKRAFIVAAHECKLKPEEAVQIAMLAVHVNDEDIRFRDLDKVSAKNLIELGKLKINTISVNKMKSFSGLFQKHLENAGVTEDGKGKHLWQIFDEENCAKFLDECMSKENNFSDSERKNAEAFLANHAKSSSRSF